MVRVLPATVTEFEQPITALHQNQAPQRRWHAAEALGADCPQGRGEYQHHESDGEGKWNRGPENRPCCKDRKQAEGTDDGAIRPELNANGW